MDFRAFLKPKMQKAYLLDRTEGSWSGGIWQPGTETKVEFEAAIATFTDDQLAFGEAGTYTEDDRKLFTYKKLERGQKVEIGSDKYTITVERDYSFYAKGLRMYVIKREGAASD